MRGHALHEGHRPIGRDVVPGIRETASHATSKASLRSVYSIPDGDLLAGSFPKRQERLVQGWAALRSSELEQAWKRAVNMEDPGQIEPLS